MESDAERHSPRLEIEGRQVYRLQSPRLEGRHLLWFKAWNSRSVLAQSGAQHCGFCNRWGGA